MTGNVTIEIVVGDALAIDADVLALKYAQQFYGVDELVASQLMLEGVEASQIQPRPGEFQFVPSSRAIVARNALFVGVVDLFNFGYREIRDFARRVLAALVDSAPQARHVAVTLHGAGYGLDEFEAFESEIAGFLDAINSGDVSKPLERITIVERDPGRVARLQPLRDELYPREPVTLALAKPREVRIERLRAAGYASGAKSHVFVAMPFKQELTDTYHYAIQGPVRAAGFLCERADLSTFLGDVMQWVQQRIRTAAVVIADLTQSNPNVYLEVGYAWGCGVPVVLLVQDVDELKFDVRGQRCLVYSSIRELEELLQVELEKLREKGVI